MSTYPSAREIAHLQLKYYNAHDLENFCSLFARDCILVNHVTGDIIANSPKAIREIYANRFSNSNLHCTVKHEIDLGNIAIDHEVVTGLPDGPLEIVALYHVENGKIIKVSFIRE